MGKRYNIDELEDDGFEIKPEPAKPVKKSIVEKVAAKPLAPITPAPIPQPQPPQIVYVDNREIVKQLENSNRALVDKVESLVEAFNSRKISFELDIKRDQNNRMTKVFVTSTE